MQSQPLVKQGIKTYIKPRVKQNINNIDEILVLMVKRI